MNRSKSEAMLLKELAKFFAGVAAWESIVHLSFATCNALPVKLCGFTIDDNINTIQIIVPTACSLVLAWYGWVYKTKDITERQ